MQPFELTVTPRIDDGRHFVWASRVTSRDGFERRITFWGDGAMRWALVDRADPFVLAHLMHAMQEGRVLRVRGAPVSPGLVRNLDRLQDHWIQWKGLRRVEIDAEWADDTQDAPGGALVAFSGGVDSAHIVWESMRGAAPVDIPPLTGALMVHGFDIALLDRDGWPGALRRSEKLLAGSGVRLHWLATDLRDGREDWGMAHGLALGAALSLFGGGFAAGLIGSTAPYGQVVLPWGSNPLTDPLMSSPVFAIHHLGTHRRRLDKIRDLAGWPEALAHLRYCWRSRDPSRNCGRCIKCTTAQIVFRTLDLVPPCVDRPASDEQLSRVLDEWPYAAHTALLVRDLCTDIRRTGRNDRWVAALERCLRRIEEHEQRLTE